MNDLIGGYLRLTPMQTTGSGSARWCIAVRGLQRYFLKEFLSPVVPVRTDTPLGQRQMARCEQFEAQKQRLYAAASCVIGDMLVPVVDFFRAEGHYYAVTEAAPERHLTAEAAHQLTDDEKRKLLYDLALCLQRLHAQGVVHADLKPEHVLLLPQQEGWQARLIDLDSGFLVEDPPKHEREMEGDPAYLAPEMFLRMMGGEAPLGPALDIFAFGAMIHQIWTGRLPDFDHERYHYLYEAALEGGTIGLDLPEDWEIAVRRMLRADPVRRPTDAEIVSLFEPERSAAASKPSAANGLSRFMKA